MELYLLPLWLALVHGAVGLAAVRPPSLAQLPGDRWPYGAVAGLSRSGARVCGCGALRRHQPVRGRGALGTILVAVALQRAAAHRHRGARNDGRRPAAG